MAQSETVERILDAAEQLFAEKGFAETSLRLITSKAGVNLAAVNYHFGSKKALIQAVFSRFLGPFCASLEKELDRRQAKPEAQHATLEDLLHLLVSQAMAVKPRSGNDLSIFMRLLGLAFSQSQGHLRKYLEEVYGKVFRRYMLLVNEAAPKLPPIELFWRVHFMLGAAAFSMSGTRGPAGDGGNRFRREHFHRAGDAPDGAVLRCRHARRERHRRSAAGRGATAPAEQDARQGLIADGAPGRRFPFSFLCAPGGTPCAGPAPLAGARYCLGA